MGNMSGKTEPVPEFLFTDHIVYPIFSPERHKVRITFKICGFT